MVSIEWKIFRRRIMAWTKMAFPDVCRCPISVMKYYDTTSGVPFCTGCGGWLTPADALKMDEMEREMKKWYDVDEALASSPCDK